MTLPENRFRRFLFPAWVALLLLLMAVGVAAAILVFTQGLVVTNLTDLVPWGLWITIDLSAIALSAGAFLLSATVYLLRLKQYQPVARTAVFVGVVGYSIAMLMLLLDIGRPDRFWHALAFWNIHSPLWEVTMCICLYFSVLFLEVIPIFGKSYFMQRRWPRVSWNMGRIHHLAPVLAVLGLGLSMMHQSSLGAAYGVLKARPIWYRPELAVLFIFSAMVAGPALTIFATKVAGKLSTKAYVDDALLDPLSHFIGWALLAYLIFRIRDILVLSNSYQAGRSEGLDMLLTGPFAFNFWGGEILLGIVVPMIILLISRLRRQPRLNMLALLLVVGGLVAFRWDVNLVGQMVASGVMPQDIIPRFTSYVPSLVEFAAGAGVIAYGLLAFTLGVRYLKVVDHSTEVEHEVIDSEAIPVKVVSK